MPKYLSIRPSHTGILAPGRQHASTLNLLTQLPHECKTPENEEERGPSRVREARVVTAALRAATAPIVLEGGGTSWDTVLIVATLSPSDGVPKNTRDCPEPPRRACEHVPTHTDVHTHVCIALPRTPCCNVLSE